MELVNLTPHPLKFYNESGELVREIPSSGLARVRQTSHTIGDLDGIPLSRSEYGEIYGLPDPTEGKFFLVSVYVLNAAESNGRTTSDLGVPDDFVRNESGNIVGSRRIRQL